MRGTGLEAVETGGGVELLEVDAEEDEGRLEGVPSSNEVSLDATLQALGGFEEDAVDIETTWETQRGGYPQCLGSPGYFPSPFYGTPGGTFFNVANVGLSSGWC